MDTHLDEPIRYWLWRVRHLTLVAFSYGQLPPQDDAVLSVFLPFIALPLRLRAKGTVNILGVDLRR